MSKIHFHNGDCIKVMEDVLIKNGVEVNVILTSPPYNSGRESNSERSLKNREARYDVHLDNMSDVEYCDWTVDLFDHFNKILAKDGVIIWNISYGNEKPNSMWLSLLSLIERTNFMIADSIVWKKKACLPNNVSHHSLSRICEFVFVICRKDEFHTYQANKKVVSVSHTGQKFYENVYNFVVAANNDGSCDLNKATYSSELCIKLLKLFAKEDDTIYDPFMGTGTTAIACEMYGNQNMTCYGSELSAAQVEYSKKRLDEYHRQNPSGISLDGDDEALW